MIMIKPIIQLLFSNKTNNKMKEVNKIKQKIQTAINILQDLADEYKFDFMLNFASGMNDIPSGSVNNKHITVDILDKFICNIKNAQREMEVIPVLLDAGYTVVICIDDQNIPKSFSGEWVKKGHIYLVKEMQISPINREDICYVLYDINVRPPFAGFNSKRFSRVFKTSPLFN